MSPAEELPSYRAACDLYLREHGALGRVGLSFGSRALLIAGALYLAGERRRLVPYALVASAAVEAFVLYWTWTRKLPEPV